jgi:uncharacterized protein (DUF302 family)
MRILIATLMALATAFAAGAADELAIKPSKHSVKETLDRLTETLKSKGITPVARVDHSAAAKAAGLELKPTEVLLFGNPKLGTPLMQSSPTAGLDLPMRVLVWQDASGAVMVGYWPPAKLAEAHGIKDRDQVLKTMAGALDAITSEAVAK